MEKTPDTSELSAFRAQIDALDDQIIELLKQRIGIVSRVGNLKRRTAPGQCPIRPGREAEMLRDITERFKHSDFSPLAAAALWRTIIGASTGVEAPLTLSAYATDNDPVFWWMAREYFGPDATILRQPVVGRVIGDVTDGKASVGVVPPLSSPDSTNWWTHLLQGNDAPRIFARIPFVYSGTPGRNTPSALAIAKISPEPTGDDCSILVLDVDENVSQNRLKTALTTAKMSANSIAIATLVPGKRYHLLEVRDFVTPDHAGLESLKTSLAGSLYNIYILGAYANPIVLAKK